MVMYNPPHPGEVIRELCREKILKIWNFPIYTRTRNPNLPTIRCSHSFVLMSHRAFE